MHQAYISEWKDFYKEINKSPKSEEFSFGLSPPPKDIEITYATFLRPMVYKYKRV